MNPTYPVAYKVSESHQFIQLVKIMINDTRIVDVNTSRPFHIAITKITAAASNPITDIAVDIFSIPLQRF